MGGRGSSSGMGGHGTTTQGFDVTYNGETTRYYFTNNGRENYYQRGVGGIPEPTPMNMSAREFRERVEKNGATVRTVSASERRAAEKAYEADRKATNEFLNRHDFNREMSRGSRAERIANRAERRGRRR